MSQNDDNEARQARMADTVRRVINCLERSRSSPQMERAFKRLIWRYTRNKKDKEV